MSTNFYLVTNEEKIHIGKRCGAGLYCRKCSQTLHAGGEEAIHTDRTFEGPALISCPKCGDRVFDTTCSFTWAIKPNKLIHIMHLDSDACITDEYDNAAVSFTTFHDMLRDMCRIHFYTSIGVEFG